MLDPTETLRQLVAIPSINPMGRDLSGPEIGEARLTDHLKAVFERMGLPWHAEAAEPGRENLVARLDGEVPPDRGGRIVLLDVHQDIVPVDGMTIPPFAAETRNGHLYGRGACDVKGGMAAMLVALSRLADERPRGRPTVIMACTVNEEYGFTGVRALVEACRKGTGLTPRLPDAAIVAEPTELDVIVAHKGVVRWRCHAPGRAGHSARPEAADNAIYKMARALVAIERYQKEVVGTLADHPLCGPATISVGMIRGGVSVNTVPDRCTIEIDRRLPPGETASAAYRHLVEHLAATFPPSDLIHDPPNLEAPPLRDDNNGPLAERLASIAQQVAGRGRRLGVPYATDAATLSGAGIPAVVFGPGSSAQAHTADEWIDLDQVSAAAEILYRFLRAA